MAILGNDDRVQLTPTPAGGYKAVVEIEVVFPDGTVARGSGAMIGRNDVLTAGHVIYSAANGGYATQIYVFPARDGVAQPYGSAMGTSALADPLWIVGSTFAHDVGVITLDRNVGDLVGWYNYATGGTDTQYTGTQIVTVGYPGDKPFGTQWFGAGTVDSSTISSLDFTSNLDVIGGQSGSPIFLGNTIIGVVSNTDGATRNQAIRVQSSFAGDVAAKIAGDAAQGFWPVSTADAGNTSATAKPIFFPLGALGVVGQASDPADWYSFDAATSGTATLSLTGTGNPLQLIVTDASGHEVAAVRSGTTGDRTLVFNVVAGQHYFIDVEAGSAALNLSGYVIQGKIDTTQAIHGDLTGTTVRGTAGADLIVITGNDNFVFGDAGDDWIEVRSFGPNGTTVQGNEGRDLLALPGFATGYQVTKVEPGVVRFTPFTNVAGVATGKQLTVVGIEYVQFSDKLLFTLSQSDADVARLYTAALGRTPDIGGLNVQVAANGAGLSLHDLANNFVASAEFTQRFGTGSDADFVERMYVNSLGRASDAGGKSFWLDYLAHGHDRADVLVGFATSPEHASRTGDWLMVI